MTKTAMTTAPNAIEKTDAQWYQQTVERISQMLADISNNIQNLGTYIAEAIDHNPRARNLWLKDVPNLKPGMLDALERIGRGQLMPGLLMNSSPYAEKLRLAPASVQRQILDQGVPIVEKIGDRYSTNYKPLDQLTPSDARSVFRGNRVLSIEEQNSNLSGADKSIKMLPDWEPVDCGLAVHRPCIIGDDAIITLAEDAMKRKRARIEAGMKEKQIKRK
jgi:hypothetical protein